MIRRLILAAVILGAVYFTVQGGEYSTLSIWRQRRQEAALQRQVDSLQREVDSLQRVKARVDSDPATQERIGREEFGLVHGPKEILYKFAGPNDASALRDSAE